MPRTLIGVPTMNGPDRLWRCLASIREHTDLSDVALVVSDDCSKPEHLERNKHAAAFFGAPMLMTEQRLGVSAQWNRLVRHVPDTVVCALVNDDVEVAQDWLDVLEFSLVRNEHVGMVGLSCETGVTRDRGALPRPFVDFHSSRLQDGGGTVLASGGACFAFRRSDWDAVGGFDERYFYFYEEIDFGVSLATKLGKINVVADYPVVYHAGGATVVADNPSVVLHESREKFASKWGTSLDSIRQQLSQRALPVHLEWNSQWKNWRS